MVKSMTGYGRGEADYINCPMDKEQYERFYQALVTAESVELHEFEKKDFSQLVVEEE